MAPDPTMTTEPTVCPRCGNRHGHTPLDGAACAYWTVLRDTLQDYAATLDRPAPAAAVADLLAFLADTHGAAHGYLAARHVLDLGWRPTAPTDAQISLWEAS